MNTLKLIRYVVAYVFITSGIMKLLDAELSSFFVSLGLPFPMMYTVAFFEIICGAFILLNKNIKNATIPLIIIMIAAFLLTKVPILHSGFLQFAFDARLDITMLILLFILYNSHYRSTRQ
ncbi:hypothetical protein DCC39_08595 [Pueribacillus theae]|uniref:DoxX family protein n=1 Tax=Pueribacillus theae TaxID=2171751 RepID=A0A2U1K397_9BACI|nr:DoxX family protein [Pueribacillus theae]PWA11981.1 hypothetical protein DCC39_08595 [Pueribacillus theae]